MNIEKFDRLSLQEFQRFLNRKFAEIEEQTGVKLKLGNISHSDKTFSSKLEGVLANGKNGTELDKENYIANCTRYGLKKEDFGKKVLLQGRTYTICGLNTARSKYNVRIKDQSGKISLATVDTVKRAMI